MADPLPLDSNLPDTAGISDEDRREIFAQIDKVARESRLQAGPERFVLKARKRGIFVPLTVNLGALVVLLAGLATLWLLFRQGAHELVQNQVVLQSTEGKLLEELRKESETQLLAKDQQIADIQKRMDTLAQQKNDLQATMDQKIAAKEAALKVELQQALAAERVRLTQAGFNQAAIEDRLRTFEKQKTAEFEQQLAEFKKKAAADRADLESNLKRQQDEFQKNLSDLAGERQRLLDDSKRKQSELQAQLDQKSRDLEAQQTASKAQLAQAQQVLRDLNDEKAKTESVQNQLLGLYTKVSQAIQSRQFPEAQKQLQGLVGFLNDPSVRSLPDIQKRRDGDLLLAATLTDWLSQDQKRLDGDAARLQTTQSTLGDIQNLVQQAEQANAAGKADDAEGLYNKALGQLPAVLEAHQYFLDKALKTEQTRQATVADALAAGDAALSSGNWTDAVSAYTAALAGLPLTVTQREAFASRWSQASFETELPSRQAQLDEAAKKDLAAAQALVKTRQPGPALAAYVSILTKYPVGQVGFASLAGIRQASAQLQGPSARETALDSELAQTKDALARAKAELDQAQQKLAATPPPPAAGTGAAALKNAQEEAARLRTQAASLQAMRAGFQDFLTKDGPLWAQTPDSTQVLQSKLLLNGFLNSPEVSAAFPGLGDKIGRYEKSFLEAGQKEGLINVNDAVSNLSQLPSPEERKQYLAELQRRYQGNAAMTETLKNLTALF